MRAGGLGLQAGKVLGASQQRRTCKKSFFFFFFYYLWRSLLRNDDKISCSRTVRSLLVLCHVCAPPASRSKERRLGFQEHRPQPRSSVAPSKPSSRSRSAVVALTSVLINHNTRKAESENQKRERPTRGQVRRAANPGRGRFRKVRSGP